MSNNAAFNLLQQGLRISLGATTSLVETIQDPQKRRETLTELQTQVSQQTQIWAEKGEVTEAEAKEWIESWLEKQKSTSNGSKSQNTDTASNINFSEAQREIEDLTAQIAALKIELEQTRSPSP
ncbi:MAG: hypothetical protein ACRC6M_10135 [Microcystaceae cyanobacterium]